MRPLSLFQLIQRRKQRQKQRAARLTLTVGKWEVGIVALFSLLAMSMMLLASYAYTQLTRDLPSLDNLPILLDLQKGLLLQPTRLYDRTGQHLLFSLENPGVERHFLTGDLSKPDHFSPTLIQMTISLYEPDFWNSPGFDWQHISSPQPITLAERLANELLLDNEPADLRHALRLRLLAGQITNRFSKNTNFRMVPEQS